MDASFLSVQFFTAKIKYLRSQKYDNGVEKNSLPVLPPIIFTLITQHYYKLNFLST